MLNFHKVVFIARRLTQCTTQKMKNVLLILTFSFSLSKISVCSEDVQNVDTFKDEPKTYVPPDYYWRHFTGEIPHDAVVGGRDYENKIFYIGQALAQDRGSYTGNVVPGVIFPGVPEVTIELVGMVSSSVAAKILCAVDRRDLQWLKIQNVTELEERHAVVGGSTPKFKYYIGRGYFNGSRVLGKVLDIAHDAAWDGHFQFVYDGKFHFLENNFQVLVYRKLEVEVTTETQAVPENNKGILHHLIGRGPIKKNSASMFNVNPVWFVAAMCAFIMNNYNS